jgi:predicted Zn-dependent protease
MGTKARSKSPVRALLFALLGVTALGGGVFWARRYQRAVWLERATIEELSKAASKDESDVEIFLRLGLRAKEASDWPRAARAFGHACELAPDRVECWVSWARAVYEFVDYTASDAILSDFVKRHPDNGTAYLERAALRRDAKRNDLAWEDINKAIKLLPKEGSAQALKGELCIDMSTFQAAQAAFLEAKKLMPDSPWPLMGFYHSSIEMNSLVEAETAARELRKRFPEIIEGRLYLGEVLLLGSKSDAQLAESIQELHAAEKQMKNTSNRTEGDFTLNLLLGRAYFSSKKYNEALPYLQKSVELTSDNPDALFYLGRTYRALGNEKKSIEVMAEHRVVYQSVAFVRKKVAILGLNPNDSASRLELARWYRSQKAYKSALVHYEELISRGQGGEEAAKERLEIVAKLKELAAARLQEGVAGAKAP